MTKGLINFINKFIIKTKKPEYVLKILNLMIEEIKDCNSFNSNQKLDFSNQILHNIFELSIILTMESCSNIVNILKMLIQIANKNPLTLTKISKVLLI